MHDPLGHALAIELLHLLYDVRVVEHGRAARADGQRVVVAGRGDPGSGRGRRWASIVAHEASWLSGSGWAWLGSPAERRIGDVVAEVGPRVARDLRLEDVDVHRPEGRLRLGAHAVGERVDDP